MQIDLTGRTAIVTGAARGIGQATVRAFLESGASVLATDVLDDEGRELVGRLGGANGASGTSGARVLYEHLDVAEEAQWRAAVARAENELGPLRILVNNAGIGSTGDVETETLEEYERVVAVNQTSVWLGMKTAGPAIRAAGGGSIVNVASIFGSVGGFGASIAYHAAKGAVRLMTKNAALHWATQGVRVNSVHPGFVDTPLIGGLRGTDVEREILAMTPMGRLAEPEEVASVIAFLASELASYMTGSEVYVDGGWTAR